MSKDEVENTAFIQYKRLAGITGDGATHLLDNLSTESKSYRMKNMKRLVVKQRNCARTQDKLCYI